MILHCNEFKNEEAHQQIKDIQDSSITCLIKILKFYKVNFFSPFQNQNSLLTN